MREARHKVKYIEYELDEGSTDTELALHSRGEVRKYMIHAKGAGRWDGRGVVDCASLNTMLHSSGFETTRY